MEFSLTVLICVHSYSDFYDDLLLRALKSLENQTYKSFKTLIVLDECWKFTESHIKKTNLNLDITIKQKEKKEGLSFAKNFGLSFIDTDLVAFLDGDDLYVQNKIEKQIDYFRNNEVDFLATQSWNIYGNENDEKLIESCFKLGTYETHEEIKNKIFSENVLTHGSLMVKMKSLQELGFYNTGLDNNGNCVKGREDWNLYHIAFIKGFRFHQLQERLYIYRMFTGVSR
jgi:glycosyltransferase involved in cell wall biosynthesis